MCGGKGDAGLGASRVGGSSPGSRPFLLGPRSSKTLNGSDCSNVHDPSPVERLLSLPPIFLHKPACSNFVVVGEGVGSQDEFGTMIPTPPSLALHAVGDWTFVLAETLDFIFLDACGQICGQPHLVL